jgi:hypothetical protein
MVDLSKSKVLKTEPLVGLITQHVESISDVE